jgi:hypothetical protein
MYGMLNILKICVCDVSIQNYQVEEWRFINGVFEPFLEESLTFV